LLLTTALSGLPTGISSLYAASVVANDGIDLEMKRNFHYIM